ncbi:hypothetical protein GCM10027341_04090 [Spirosoma knui]
MKFINHFYRILLSGVALAGTGIPAWAQDQTLTRIQQQVDTDRSQTLQEKLFVHTDRSFYLTGETMWFRFYYVDGSYHRPLNVSKVAYLEVLDKDQKAVLQTKVALSDGKGTGSLLLPTALSSGQYVLRAYTHWMKAVSPEFLFEKTVTIVNPFRKLGLTAPTDSLAYDVQFFPEGGNLVNGLPAKMAFKVVDRKSGRGVDCRGALVSQTNDTLVRFTSLKFGMGHFSFTPVAGTPYRVVLKDGQGHTVTRSLPQIYEQGYTMQVDEANADQLNVTIRARRSADDTTNPIVYLVGHTRQSVNVAEMRVLQNNEAQFLIPKQRLGEGISYLTVFSGAAQPVCERLYFKRPQANLLIQATSNQPTYGTRAPVTLTLKASDAANKPQAADLSVSVYRIDSLQSGEGAGIADYLWLTSDLKGTIESPEYYLTHTGADVDSAIDNLMLTQGWRRFRWETVLQPRPTDRKAAPEYAGHVVQGRVMDSRTGKAAADVVLYLSIPGKAIQLYSTRTDAQGVARFEVDNFYGPKDLVMQTEQPDSLYRVEIINPYAESPALTRLPVFNLAESVKEEVVARSLAMQVQNSYHNQYVVQSRISADSSTFYGVPDERYRLDAYTRFTIMEEVLREYVTAVQPRQRDRHFYLRVSNLPYREFFNEEPLILLDGVPITNTDRLMAFSPLKIQTLDVVARRYFLGPSKLSGIVSFRTYKGDLAGFQLDPRQVVLEYEGLQAQREFYAPQYATAKQRESRLPDFRNLLYWNPQVATTQQGQAIVTFPTADQQGTYLVVVHGMTTDGRAATGQQSIVVSNGLK